MIKAYYFIQNSSKNLIRTSGIGLSCVLIFILSFLSFFFLNLSSFLAHCHSYTINEAMQMGTIGLTEIISPAGMLLTVFKFISFLIACLFIINTINTIRRLFFQLANDQRSSFQIMSFIGETTEWISLEFALQAVYVSFTLLLFGFFSANLTFGEFLSDSLAFGSFEGILDSFTIDQRISLLVIILSSSYIGIRVFFFVRKYLFSFFDNLLAEISFS